MQGQRQKKKRVLYAYLLIGLLGIILSLFIWYFFNSQIRRIDKKMLETGKSKSS
jgi:hypothetical protein